MSIFSLFGIYDFIVDLLIYQLVSLRLNLISWLQNILLVDSVDLLGIFFFHMDNHATIFVMAMCYIFGPGHIQAVDRIWDLSHGSTSAVTLNHGRENSLNRHVLVWVICRLELEILGVVAVTNLVVNVGNLGHIVEVVHFTNLSIGLALITSMVRRIICWWVRHARIILTLFRHLDFFCALICSEILLLVSSMLSRLIFHESHFEFGRLLLHVGTRS